MYQLTWRKSTYSEAAGANCVELASSPAGRRPWQKSSYSTDQANCVELATSHTDIHLRESDTPRTHLTTSPHALAALLGSIKQGEFDHLAAS
ncbi:DUF397 domain-containing protein [Streptomyces zagrosensis]|uniref:DUF397 domain-containing protein n=1 Tax=Streptomyces zagrosensis TaxID=1042984 RepID=A0A7W9QGS2_9ACTN|nr:DUF397 domain-containing protein [Streptomyces zagrosensis]MBB5939418.1 hypothetical protein [Streptomyces zagrosensis]